MDTSSKSYIDVTNSVKTKLAKLFGCSETFVYMALTYRKNTELAKKIRYVAVREYNGKSMRHCPECETMFITHEGGHRVMEQTFDNGAKLIADLVDSSVRVYNRKGESVGDWPNVTLVQLSEIQMYAEAL